MYDVKVDDGYADNDDIMTMEVLAIIKPILIRMLMLMMNIK